MYFCYHPVPKLQLRAVTIVLLEYSVARVITLPDLNKSGTVIIPLAAARAVRYGRN